MPAPHVEHPFMNGSVGSIRATWAAMLAAVVVTTSGCTSAISTAYLRDTFWDLPDHAAAEEPQADATADAEGQPAVEISDTGVADEERREAAIAKCIDRGARAQQIARHGIGVLTQFAELLNQTRPHVRIRRARK
jgi:hypothetical protein